MSVDLQTAPPERERYRVLSAAEIFAPLPPLEYAIGGVLPRFSLSLLVAFGSSFKTWIVIDGGLAIADGGLWLDRFSCARGRWLFVDWESGDREGRRRIQRNARARGHLGVVDGVELITMPDLFFNSPDFESEMMKLAAGRTLVTLDSLAAGTVDLDENDARFAGGLRTLKRVAEATGAAIQVIHHTRKDGPNGAGDERQAVRGSGAIFAAVDVVLHLAKREDGSMLLTQTKARLGKAIDPLVVRVEDVGADATRVYSCAHDESAEEEGERAQALSKAKQKVIGLLARDHDVRNATEVHTRLGGRKQDILLAVRELRDRALVVEHEGALRLASEVAQ